LGKSLTEEPGTVFYYNTGLPNVMGEVVHRATGTPLDEFAREHLFAPLGIRSSEWSYFRNGTVNASSYFKLIPRDMLKIGQLCLNGGTWEGHRIVSSDWIQRSSQPYIVLDQSEWGTAYGYFWWLQEFDFDGSEVRAYAALGYAGQNIFVFPEQNMAVVFTGSSYVGQEMDWELLERFLVPASMQKP
jgi:CubicO group peptidase (beta-lactamase class C family)